MTMEYVMKETANTDGQGQGEFNHKGVCTRPPWGSGEFTHKDHMWVGVLPIEPAAICDKSMQIGNKGDVSNPGDLAVMKISQSKFTATKRV